MALRDEQTDILGGPILQRPDSSFFTTFSRYHFVFKSVTLLGLGWLVWIMCARGLEHLKKHRELRYRKAMRRKHGIPDSDCRPFAVAYAAAKRAHLEREAQDRKKTTNYVSDHYLPAVDQRTDAQKDPRGLRRRVPETTVQLHDYQPPGKHAVAYDSKRPEVHSLDSVDRYNPNLRRRATIPEPFPVERSSARRASRKNLVLINDNNEESRKRSFEDENDVEHEIIKKSRIDGDELIDGDEQADWYAQYTDLPPRRAAKECFGRQSPGNYISMDGQERSQRVNGGDHEPVDEAMEGIDEDEVGELKAMARGKKRDRAEAGSTFGCDDDEDIRNGRMSHHRKRRTIAQRRVEVPARGQKRDRDTGSPESEDEGGGTEISRRHTHRNSRKKRGKKATSDELSDMSVEDPRVSKDPLCSGRRAGDEWETEGVRYRVGDKGERLRLTLVKKARNKYHMPQDSQHPDRSAALEIYVETWMTDEQYRQAEGRQELAWQEAPRESSESKTPDVLDSPAKNGKNLLWDSVKGSPSRRPFRQSMHTGALTRINPFEQSQSQSTLGRRVASSSTIVPPSLPGVVDSPTRPGFRGFSKWEKQDREAEALARIRAKVEEQKKAQAPSPKSAEVPTRVSAPELGIKSLPVPTITLTPAGEGDSDSNTPQSKSNASTFLFASPPSAGDSIKTAPAAASIAPGFSLPSTSATTSSTHFPGAPTAPAAISSMASLSPFSFAKPLPPPTSSSTVPNPFEKGTGAGSLSASVSSPSILGAKTSTQPPSTENTSKIAPSPLARTDASSSTPSPAAFPSITKSQTPIFGNISNSSPSLVTFGPTLAGANVPVLPPVSTAAAASQISKPTIPFFSFSGASSSAATVPPSSAPSAPKFSFGQPPTTSSFIPGSNLASGTASQPKPTFKFGQASPGATEVDSTSKVPVADESKSTLPAPAFGTATGSNEPVKPSPFGTTPAFGSSTSSLPSAFATNFIGKPVIADGGGPTSTPPNTTLASASTATVNTPYSSTPAGTHASGNIPALSFGGTNSGSKSIGESKPSSLFGGGGSNPVVPIFGGSSTEKKPNFSFCTPPEGSKLTSTFGSNIEGSKSSSVFGGSTESSKYAFSGAAEASKPLSMLGGTVEKSSGVTEAAKPSTPATPSFGPTTAFTFGKDDSATNTTTTTGTQSKPTASFSFGGLSGTTGSTFGQPSISATSGDSSQMIFGKPTSTTPSAFGFAGTGGSGSSSPFTFGKPAAQNQKQEQ